jgi:hypothetical protein
MVCILQPRTPARFSDSDMFDDWSKDNDVAASVYIALTIDASSSCASTVDAMCGV